VIDDWEKKFLSHKTRLNLTKHPEIVEIITEKSGGLTVLKRKLRQI
jgi:hypothetical protein